MFKALDVDGMDMEVDLSNLGTVNTVFAALFRYSFAQTCYLKYSCDWFGNIWFTCLDSKLGVPIKTTISANVLEEALNGTVTIRPLPIGTSFSAKVCCF